MNTSRFPLFVACCSALLATTALAQTTPSPNSATTAATEPATPASKAVASAARDGITVSGKEVMVTRNGVTEVLTKDLHLPSGVHVFPDGTAQIPGSGKITLRSDQTLTFDGKLIETVATPAPPITPDLQETARAAAVAEAERRARAATGTPSPSDSK